MWQDELKEDDLDGKLLERLPPTDIYTFGRRDGKLLVGLPWLVSPYLAIWAAPEQIPVEMREIIYKKIAAEGLFQQIKPSIDSARQRQLFKQQGSTTTLYCAVYHVCCVLYVFVLVYVIKFQFG